MERLFLIGYMGAGKTTFGKILAQKRGLDFLDLDHFIEARYQKSIRQLFEDIGENRFREIERDILEEVADFENVVISTGGGAPCFFDNMSHMNNNGISIYLKSSAESLAKRLNACKDKRPLLRDKSEHELFEFIKNNLDIREKFYNQAHIVFDIKEVNNHSDIERVVSELINSINHYK